jgi:NADP-dependent 3-hydroxy acid dehydrogenase YdfG
MNIVITGSSKGIGLGMAQEFMRQGHNVIISGRTHNTLEKALDTLVKAAPGKAKAVLCDVSSYNEVQNLWKVAIETYGSVDIWINNAGITNRRMNLTELSPDDIPRVINTNLTGLINGCKIAISGMLSQGSGKIFNMEGFGADGMVDSGMSIYGTTKRAVRYFNKSMAKEYKDTDIVICTMDPGIVVTDFLTKDLYDATSETFEKRKNFLNILGDHVDDVAPSLVNKMIATQKSGTAVRWMSPIQALTRFIKSFFVKRDIFTAQTSR